MIWNNWLVTNKNVSFLWCLFTNFWLLCKDKILKLKLIFLIVIWHLSLIYCEYLIAWPIKTQLLVNNLGEKFKTSRQQKVVKHANIVTEQSLSVTAMIYHYWFIILVFKRCLFYNIPIFFLTQFMISLYYLDLPTEKLWRVFHFKMKLRTFLQ